MIVFTFYFEQGFLDEKLPQLEDVWFANAYDRVNVKEEVVLVTFYISWLKIKCILQVDVVRNEPQNETDRDATENSISDAQNPQALLHAETPQLNDYGVVDFDLEKLIQEETSKENSSSSSVSRLQEEPVDSNTQSNLHDVKPHVVYVCLACFLFFCFLINSAFYRFFQFQALPLLIFSSVCFSVMSIARLQSTRSQSPALPPLRSVHVWNVLSIKLLIAHLYLTRTHKSYRVAQACTCWLG